MARDTRGAEVRPVVTGPFAAGAALIAGVSTTTWFSPLQPLPEQAPPGTPPRTWDYPVGINLQYVPRGDENVTFGQLRSLATNYDLVAMVLETRKDQVAGVPWAVRPWRKPNEDSKAYKERSKDHPDVPKAVARLKCPDGVHLWQTWIRALVHEVLVIDALSIYPSKQQGDTAPRLDLIDGGTIKPVLDQGGRRPTPPSKAYQQIIKGVVSSNFTTEELYYRPRVWRTDRLYGFSPVEQIIVTINLALRRQLYKLSYYTEGNLPEAIAQLPETWPAEKIKQFEEWFNSALAGQLGERRRMRFIPSIGGKDAISYPKQDALKDEMDEWLARVVCYAFSVSPQPFVREMNRATAQTAQEASKAEGLQPLLDWVAEVLTDCLQNALGFKELEFAWQSDLEPDPLKRVQIQAEQIKVGIKGVDEIRELNGDDPVGVRPGIVTATGLVQFGDEQHLQDQQTESTTLAPAGEGGEASPKAGQVEKRLPSTRAVSARVAAFLERQGEQAAARIARAYEHPALPAPRHSAPPEGSAIMLQIPAPQVNVDMRGVAELVGAAVSKALAEAPIPIVHVRGGDTHVAAPAVTVEAPSVTVKGAKAPDVHVSVSPEVKLAVPKTKRTVRRDAGGKIKTVETEVVE